MKFLAILLVIAVSVSAKSIGDEERDQIMKLLFKLSPQLATGPVTPINKVFCGCDESEKCNKMKSLDDVKLDDEDKLTFTLMNLIQSMFVPESFNEEQMLMINSNKNEEILQKCPEQTYAIKCDAGHKIKIFKALISNTDKNKCPANTWSNIFNKMMIKRSESSDCTESEMTGDLMKKMCEDKMTCEFSIDKHFGNMCECAEQKYLDITYSCEPEEEKEITKEDEEIKQRAKRSLLYFLAPENKEYSESAEYRRPAEYRESYESTEYRRPAEYRESSEYRRPAEYKESSEYRRPAEYRESSEYRRPAEYRESSEYRRPAEYRRDDYYDDDYYYGDYGYGDDYGFDLVEDYIFGPFNRFHGHGGWGNFYDYLVEGSSEYEGGNRGSYNKGGRREYEGGNRGSYNKGGRGDYEGSKGIRGPARRIANFDGYEQSEGY